MHNLSKGKLSRKDAQPCLKPRTIKFDKTCYCYAVIPDAATLKESSGEAITICDPEARVGDEFLLEVEFEADPKPDIVSEIP